MILRFKQVDGKARDEAGYAPVAFYAFVRDGVPYFTYDPGVANQGGVTWNGIALVVSSEPGPDDLRLARTSPDTAKAYR